MKELVFAIIGVLGMGSLLALLDAQPLKGSADSKSASGAIKALEKKIRAANYDEKTVIDTLVECEQAAVELRKTTHWIMAFLENKNPAVKKQVLKTIAAIGDPGSVFSVMKALDDSNEEVIAQA